MQNRSTNSILLALFLAAFCAASLSPFMGYFIVEGLLLEPWHISVCSVIVTSTGMVTNRLFGEWIDKGTKIYLFVLIANICCLLALTVVLVSPTYSVLVSVFAVLLGVSSSAVTSMYSLGRLYVVDTGRNVVRYNAYLRMMTSLGWMLGPPLTFAVASVWGNIAVFKSAFVIAFIWLVAGWCLLPRQFQSAKSGLAQCLQLDTAKTSKPLWLAASACLLFSIAHTLCMAALPLYYTREIGLPTYAPGISLAVKCAVELVTIFLSPRLIQQTGQRGALYLSGGLGVLSFFVFYHVNSMASLMIGAVFEGLYYGIFAATSMTFVQGFANGKMGRATSLYMNSLFLGGTMGSVLMGVIATLAGFRAVLLAASVTILLGCLILYLTRGMDAYREPPT